MKEITLDELIKDEKNGSKKEEELITIPKRNYQLRIGKAYRLGMVNALLKVKTPIPEIARILGLKESTVESLAKKCNKGS